MKHIKYSSISFLMFLLLLTSPVFALQLTITPIQDSTTNIKDKDCGSTTQYPFSITNNGGGGVLCWYTTTDSGTPEKLTSSCVDPSATQTYNVGLLMPSSGTKSVTVQLECYDFWSIFTPHDRCVDSYDISQARTNKYSGGGAGTIAPRYFGLSCEAMQFSVTPSKNILNLFTGQSETVSITVSNQMSQSISCDKNLGSISAEGSKSYSITIQAPVSGSGATTQTETVTCSYSGASSSKSTSIIVNYQSDPCIAALNDARSAISDAQTKITDAQAKIQEANKIGADVTNAQASLNKANTQLSTAQTGLSTAQTSCNSGDRTNGVTQATSAKTSATQAKTDATDALNSAQQAITTFTQKKTEASNKISDANSAIDTPIIAINKAEGALNNATELSSILPEAVQGLDLVSEKAKINTARLKIDQAKGYIKEAQTVFDQNNFDLAKSKAQSAIDLANEANTVSTDSYTRINTVLLTLGEAGRAILAASSEISRTDETLSKMNFVIRSVENWGVVLTEAKDITSTGQSNIDQAKDLLSQAKNRLQAGVSTESVTKAIAARDKAAEPSNRLNRIVSSLSTQTQEALDKAYSDATSKVSSAEDVVKDAAGTYMATQSEITNAQNDLAEAKSQLTNVSSAINEVKTATDLTTFLTKSSLAFSALDNVNDKVNSANTHASSAKMGMYVKVGAAVAVGAGAIGGGFLYWRKRKAKVKRHELEKKGPEKVKGKVCKKCGTGVEKGHKFCPKCGKKA